MKNKFTIEKDYNITIVCEGLDINQADVEFRVTLDKFSISIPLTNIKENVFKLRLPAQFKNIIQKNTDIEYTINVKKDNLFFEVLKESFDLEYLKLKEIKIEDDTIEESKIEIQDNSSNTIEEKIINEKIESNPVVLPTQSKEQDLKELLLSSIRNKKRDIHPASRSLKDYIKS